MVSLLARICGLVIAILVLFSLLVHLHAIPCLLKGTTGYQMAQIKKLGVWFFFDMPLMPACPPLPPPDLHSPNTFTGLLLLFVPIIIYSHTAVETTFYSSLLGHLLTCPVTSQPLCVVQLKHCDLAPGFWNDQVL